MSFVEGALVQIREVTTEACVGVLKAVVRTATVALVQQTLKLLSSEIKQDHRQRNRGNGRAVVWVGTAWDDMDRSSLLRMFAIALGTTNFPMLFPHDLPRARSSSALRTCACAAPPARVPGPRSR